MAVKADDGIAFGTEEDIKNVFLIGVLGFYMYGIAFWCAPFKLQYFFHSAAAAQIGTILVENWHKH